MFFPGIRFFVLGRGFQKTPAETGGFMKQDLVWKEYLSDDERYANIINDVCFDGWADRGRLVFLCQLCYCI